MLPRDKVFLNEWIANVLGVILMVMLFFFVGGFVTYPDELAFALAQVFAGIAVFATVGLFLCTLALVGFSVRWVCSTLWSRRDPEFRFEEGPEDEDFLPRLSYKEDSSSSESHVA